MPTFKKPIENNQIIIIAAVSNPGQQPGQTYRGIVDTGAQITMVSAKVIEENGLNQIGHTLIKGITGQNTPRYG